MANKKEIFNIIHQLITEEGVDKFTMDRLAQESGLSRATLYRRYGNREDLLQQALDLHNLDLNSLDRPDVRTRILQAARTVFGRVGLVRATIDEIAQEADVGQATVYRHFGSKEGLIMAFNEAFSPRQVVYNLTAQKEGSLEEKLLIFTKNALHFFYENRDLMRLTLIEHKEATKTLTALNNSSERTVHLLARFFEQEIKARRLQNRNPQEMAFALMGMLFSFGFISPLLYDIEFTNIDHIAELVVDTFLNGLKK